MRIDRASIDDDGWLGVVMLFETEPVLRRGLVRGSSTIAFRYCVLFISLPKRSFVRET